MSHVRNDLRNGSSRSAFSRIWATAASGGLRNARKVCQAKCIMHNGMHLMIIFHIRTAHSAPHVVATGRAL